MNNLFSRNSATFQNLRNSNFTINFQDLDNEFIKLANFINNKLITWANSLEKPAGLKINIENFDGNFAFNNNKGVIVFGKIKSDYIKKKSINIHTKLIKFNSLSLIGTDLENKFNYIIPSPEIPYGSSYNNVLAGGLNSDPKFKYLSDEHFYQHSIPVTKVAFNTLTKKHINQNVVINYVAPEKIGTEKLNTNFISFKQLSESQLNASKLSDHLLNSRNQITKIKGPIYPSKFKDRSISINPVASLFPKTPGQFLQMMKNGLEEAKQSGKNLENYLLDLSSLVPLEMEMITVDSRCLKDETFICPWPGLFTIKKNAYILKRHLSPEIFEKLKIRGLK